MPSGAAPSQARPHAPVTWSRSRLPRRVKQSRQLCWFTHVVQVLRALRLKSRCECQQWPPDIISYFGRQRHVVIKWHVWVHPTRIVIRALYVVLALHGGAPSDKHPDQGQAEGKAASTNSHMLNVSHDRLPLAVCGQGYRNLQNPPDKPRNL